MEHLTVTVVLNKLSHIYNTSTDSLVQRKVKVALRKARMALTLIEQATTTLEWARQYDPKLRKRISS